MTLGGCKQMLSKLRRAVKIGAKLVAFFFWLFWQLIKAGPRGEVVFYRCGKCYLPLRSREQKCPRCE